MIRRQTLISCLFLAAVCIFAAGRVSFADQYVWARVNGGNGSMFRPLSAMGNGYGGYYVPKNAYGNNYEGQPITNPTGYIIPAQTASPPQPKPSGWFHWRCRK